MARKTTSEFLKQAKLVHGDKWDYSKTDYVTARDKIIVICRLHGEFKQLPNSHLKGKGCPLCTRIIVNSKNTRSIQDFIEMANKVHENKYRYENVVYDGSFCKVTIVCPEHGEFRQTPASHMQGIGCPDCGKRSRKLSVIKNRLNKKMEDIVQPEDHKLIPLTKGKFAMVDNEDFDRVKDINWHCNSKGYARNTKVGLMHRYIMNAPDHLDVDHIHHNTLDNRKSQLRLVTPLLNSWNQSSKSGTSRHVGVHWNSYNNKWTSSIRHDGRLVFREDFEDEDEAGRARDVKALSIRGEFAYLNFPELKEQYLKELESIK